MRMKAAVPGRWMKRLAVALACWWSSMAVQGADVGSPGKGVARTIAFYPVCPVSAPPVLDGRLDDPCWQTAAVATTYYEYWKPNPALGSLQAELRILYDAQGIYVGITNHEKHPAMIRAACRSRDDRRLWTDDCAEIFFDPDAQGVGYMKFTINSLGTQGDMKRLDTAVVLNEWSGDQWQAAAGRGETAWTIEAFFPWSDLGRRAGTGDVWRFNHVRYAYTTGRFVGVTWAPGGNHERPQDFGFLYFAERGEMTPQAVGEVLGRRAAAPWNLPLEEGVLSCAAPGQVAFRPSRELLARQRAALDECLKRTEAAAARHGDRETAAALAEYKKDVTPPGRPATGAAETLEAVRRLAETQEKVEELYWQLQVNGLIREASDAAARTHINSCPSTTQSQFRSTP